MSYYSDLQFKKALSSCKTKQNVVIERSFANKWNHMIFVTLLYVEGDDGSLALRQNEFSIVLPK